MHFFGLPPKKKTTSKCELVHTPDMGGTATDIDATHEEKPMSDSVARSHHPAYSLLISTHFTVVCLFCLLGLALAAALIPMIAPETLNWTLSHIE